MKRVISNSSHQLEWRLYSKEYVNLKTRHLLFLVSNDHFDNPPFIYAFEQI